MKIGCCANMVSTLSDGTGIERIEELGSIGYDYIELPLAQIMELTEERFHQINERIALSRINCEVCNNFFPAKIRLTGDKVDKDKTLEYLTSSLKKAAGLGASVIVFGSSGAKNIPEGFPLLKAWDQIVSLLQSISTQAEKYGITIVIEPLNKLESNFINNAGEGLQLVKEVNRDNIRLLIDYYHMHMEKEDESVITEAGSLLRHVHFARPEGRVYPSKADSVDYKLFFDTIKKTGYDERISVEAYTSDFAEDAKKTLELLRYHFNK